MVIVVMSSSIGVQEHKVLFDRLPDFEGDRGHTEKNKEPIPPFPLHNRRLN